MNQQLTPPDFLKKAQNLPVLDVRAPAEYRQGHIPGAISFPLFTDEERAKVGTRYKQNGKEAAFVLGLQLVGPKMADFVKNALKLAPQRQIAVHCWRGGQRSGSMAWLLRQAGFEVWTLAGGYKAYRQWVLQAFAQHPLPIRVVGGKTGTGKTRILHALQQAGEQVVDLEALARHKGSAFGFIGEPDQPTVEQFENELWAAAGALDPTRPVWVENESRSIGRAFIPEGFWRQMKAATLFHVSIPDQVRVQNLIEDYTSAHLDALKTAFEKIASKLGGLRYKNALLALEAGNFAAAAEIALEYYDKTYQHCLDVNQSPDIRVLPFEHGDPQAIAQALIQMER